MLFFYFWQNTKIMKKTTFLLLFWAYFFNLNAQNANLIPEKVWKLETLEKARWKNFYYLILEFDQMPTFSQQQKMAEEGIFLENYQGQNQFWTKIKANVSVQKIEKWNIKNVKILPFQQKTSGQFFNENGFFLVDALVFKNIFWSDIQTDCAELGIKLILDQSSLQVFSLEIPSENLDKLLQKAWLIHLCPITKNVLLNDIGRNQTRSNVLSDGIRNLNGKNIKIGVFDGGNIGNHIDFAGNRVQNQENSPISDHATHIVGILAGSGNLNPKAKGMVNQAEIFAYQYDFVPYKMYQAVQNQQISITQNSYGNNPTCNGYAPYTIVNRQEDMLVNLFPHLAHVFAVGNSQKDCAGGFGSTAGQSAKNTITVGGLFDDDLMTTFSSWGPVRDGRIKPDLVTLGRGYFSTFPNQNYYISGDGTSQACPAVAGVVAQLQERFQQIYKRLPPASLIKAVLCNTAKDLGNPYPDFKFGFGRINALGAVKSLEENNFKINKIFSNQTQNIEISVPEGATKLKVLIAWSDPAAMPDSKIALINDLDLTIIEKQNTSKFLPWVLDPSKPYLIAERGVDRLNNIEQITIDNPKGIYQISVNANNLISQTQEYSLSWQIEKPLLEVTFPLGNEKISGEQIFRWNSEGISGKYKVEFSGNNGETWDLLSENVENHVTQADFIVPSRITTSKGLMRVSSGNVSALSANNFHVFTAPINLKITASNNQANFSWNAIDGANSYDLLKLNLESDSWERVASKINATNYQLSGLPNGKELWFAVQARQDLTGTVSQRSVAKNVISSGVLNS